MRHETLDVEEIRQIQEELGWVGRDLDSWTKYALSRAKQFGVPVEVVLYQMDVMNTGPAGPYDNLPQPVAIAPEPAAVAGVLCETCRDRLTELETFEVHGPMLSVSEFGGHAMYQSVKHHDEVEDEGVLALCQAWPWGS